MGSSLRHSQLQYARPDDGWSSPSPFFLCFALTELELTALLSFFAFASPPYSEVADWPRQNPDQDALRLLDVVRQVVSVSWIFSLPSSSSSSPSVDPSASFAN